MHIDLTLHDNETNRRNSEWMRKLEMLLGPETDSELEKFFDTINDSLEWGKTYRLTFEEVKT